MATKIFAYISPICREAPLKRIHMKFCMSGHLADVINRAKFYLNRVSGYIYIYSNSSSFCTVCAFLSSVSKFSVFVHSVQIRQLEYVVGVLQFPPYY